MSAKLEQGCSKVGALKQYGTAYDGDYDTDHHTAYRASKAYRLHAVVFGVVVGLAGRGGWPGFESDKTRLTI